MTTSVDITVSVDGCEPRQRRALGRPRRGEPLARLRQMLRQHLYVRENRHEVRVAGPAGDDVLVHVVDDPGAGNSAEVPAEVVALRLIDSRERAEPLGGEAMDLERLVVVELAEVADVPERGHQQVA